MKEREKIMIEIITTQMEDAAVITKAILAEEDTEDVEEAVVDSGRGNNSDHLKNVE
jgi:hypothetical protein